VSKSRLDKYGSWVIGDQLGRGGFGTTYKAHREIALLGRKHTQVSAVKVIRQDLLGDATVIEDFLTEITLLSRINSPYIASLIDSGVEGDEIWFAQELINGMNLSRFAFGNPLSEAIWEDLATQMLLALKSTHAENVSHLDIKPPNIVFARGSDSFRLIDFGISKTQSAQGVGSKISGTWTYMPLEQFEGTPHKQSDIWSLGVTLYEVATDIHPIVSKYPDWTSMSEFDKYQACYNFAVAPEVDWTLVNNDGHRQLIKSMIEPALHKRPTPSVLLQELRAIQGYRDPILTLGGARGPYEEGADHWIVLPNDGQSEFDKWQRIRKALPDLLAKKGTRVATITVDVQSPDLTDIDIRCELYAGGKTLKLTAPEPKSPGLHKAHSLGWEAAQKPSEIFIDLPGSASFEEIGHRISDLLEIAFSLPATQIRIF
jgi:serine/threonine protein kinase